MLKKSLIFILCIVVACGTLAVGNILLNGGNLSNIALANDGQTKIVLQIGNSKMTVNDEEIGIDADGTAPVIKGGRTLLPVRAVVEAIGGTVGWNANTKTVTLTKANDIILLIIDNMDATLNGQISKLDVAPTIINSRTMLPIRFIAESLGFSVLWEATTGTITLTNEKNEEAQNSKILVAYFSMPETTNPENMTQEEANSTVVINGEVLGNTQYVAYVIKENTRADIFRIEPKVPYPTNHTTLVDLAQEEQNTKFRPELLNSIENIREYDTIFLGYPNWWGDMPMILYTFLEQHNLDGKTIIPFNTHGGSGFSSTIATIASLKPNAIVDKDGFTVSRNIVADAEPDIIAWLKKIGLNNQ